MSDDIQEFVDTFSVCTAKQQEEINCLKQQLYDRQEDIFNLENDISNVSITLKNTVNKLTLAKSRIKELEEIVQAVAHIGVDFGYGEYVFEEKLIKQSRNLLGAKDET